MRKIYFLLCAILCAVISQAQVSVTATAGTPGPTAYTNLSSAFTAINAGTHQGAITIDISASFTDVATSVLNSNGAGSALYTSVLIRPSADGVTMSFATVTGRGVIELNGADNVTIDGDNPNTGGTNRNLTIANTAANTITFTSCIRLATSTLITNCDNVSIRNTNLTGSGTGRNTSAFTTEVTTWGVIVSAGASTVLATTAPSALSSAVTAVPTGQTHANLLIDNNNIQTVARGISTNGSATNVALGLLITNNTIGNTTVGAVDQVTAVGITAQGTSNGVIRGNTVRLEGFIGSSTPNRAINVGMVSTAGVTGLIIERNIVERAINNNGGSWTAVGIDISGGNNHIIQNNFIGDCLNSQVAGSGAFSTTFGAFGIRINAGTGHKVYHNSVSFTGVIPGALSTDLSACFCIVSTTSTGMDVRNNIFSNRATGGNPTPYNTVFASVFVPSITGMSLTMNNNAYFQGTLPNSGIGQVSATGSAANLFQASNFNPTSTSPASNWRSVTSAMGTATNDNASYGLPLAPPFVSSTDLHIPNGTATPLESTGAGGLVANDFDGQVRNVSTPDMGADEFAGIFADILPPSISYTPLSGTLCATNRTLSAIIVDLAGLDVAPGTKPRIWYKKSTNANVLPGTNTNTTDGWKYTEATNAASPFSFTIDYSLVFGGVAAGDNIQYFVVAQDLATTPNVAINSGTFTGTPTSVALAPGNFPIGGTINNYTIGAGGLSGAVTIGAAGTYPSLTGAGGLFAALNASGLSGDMTASILDASVTETGANALNQISYGCAGTYTLTINPGSGVTSTLTGSLASGALIKILSSNVIIDGSNNGSTSRDLTITNTSVTSPTVVLIGSIGTAPTTNVTLRNSIIINGVNTASAVAITDGTTLGSPGYFTNITVRNNSVQRAFIGVYCNAVVTPGNGSGLILASNDLSTAGANAIRLCGLYAQGVDGGTITQNTIGNFETTSAENDVSIWLATGTANTTISGNTVSALAYTGTSANAPFGIRESSGLGASGNIITGNSVTNITTTGGTAITGIENSSGGTIIEKNNVSGVVNNNTSTFGAYGINVSAGNNTIVRNNFVSNVTHNMTGGAAFSTTFGVFGIRIAAGTGHKVYHNSVNMYGLMPGTTATSLLSAAFALVGTTSTGCDVRNNIFANTITGGTTSIAAVSAYLPSAGTAAMGLIWNNNAYYFGTDAARQGVGQAGTTAGTNFYTTLATLTAYSNTLGNATNDNLSSAASTAAPYISNTNLHIDLAGANCPISNAGAAVGVVDDIDGDSRNAVTPDLGADEFVASTEPTITLGTNPVVCSGAVSANLPYSGTTNGPDQYSIDYDAAAEAQGFVDVVNAALPASPITIVIAGAVPGTYNATLKVRNSSTGCVSNSYSFTVTINPINTIILTSAGGTDAQLVCSNSPIVDITYLTTNATGATVTGLPAGVTGTWASNVVTISGTPTASGVFNYTVNLIGGCGTVSATGTITVNPTPSATIAYPGSPYCTFGTTAGVALTGTTGGTFSSTAGLVINPATGDVTLNTSTPGTYTVTYSIAASGPCPAFSTTASITIQVCVLTCIEDFNGVTIPALPSGWSATSLVANASSQPWMTTTAASASAPNSVGTNEPSTVSDEVLDSRIYTIAPFSTQLVFSNSFNLESGASTGFDGMVLEISINGGAFSDIITAGGSFVTGGYIRAISTGFSSPIGGRQAWTGNSGGFINTIVTLPAAALGQNVVFRWRRATDSSVSGAGANIDDVYTIGTATISYAGTPYCSDGGTATVTFAGTPGGTYTSTAGLSINATTGVVNLAASTAGTYTVNYTIQEAPGCPTYVATASIEIVAAPTATISYTGSPYCQNAGTANVTLVGTTGGTYTSTAGLSIDASTGAVDLGASTAGTYTVTYSLGAAPPCAAFSTTTTITITTPPAATISYAGSPYCQNAGTATVTFAGTTGGTYSSTAGLSINATTGTVTLGTSTAGTYTVTYTVAAAGGCPVFTTTASITINPTPTAVATPASQSACSGTPITTIVLSGAVPGTTYSWIRNNTATVTGIPANGTGNISGTLTNTTTAPITVTFTITPTASGCTGTAITATVIVNPTPTVSAGGLQVIITGSNGDFADEITWTLTNGSGTVVLTGGPYGLNPPPTPSAIVASNNGPYSFFIEANGTFNDNSCLWEVRCGGVVVANGCIRGTASTSTCGSIGTLTVGGIAACGSNLGAQTICSGSSITPITLSGPVAGTTYSWTRNNTATVTGIAASGTGNISGTLTNTTNAPVVVAFTITPTANGCAGPAVVVNVTVNPIPVATATPSTQTVCSGPITTIVLTSPVAGTTYAWTRNNTVNVTGIPANGTGSSISGTLTNTTLVSQTVTFTITPTANGCVGAAITATVILNAAPTIVCPGNLTIASVVGGCTAVATYTPTVTGAPTPTLTYVLTGATTGSGSGSGSGLAYNVGVTTVTITATNTCGTAVCSFTITVTDSQLPTITAQPTTRTVCAGSNTTFSVTAVTAPSAGGPIAYQWQQFNGTIWVNVPANGNTSTYTLSNVSLIQNTHTYRVVLTGLCSVVNSNAATLFVSPTPGSVTISASQPAQLLPTQTTTLTATASPAGGTFVWFYNGVVIPGATGATLGPIGIDRLGTYRAVYTTPAGCTATSANFEVTAAFSSELYVYPNPNRGVFQVRFFNQSNEPATVMVFSAGGQKVYEQKVVTGITSYSQIQVDLGFKANGIYIVQVVNGSGKILGSKRIVVQYQ